MSVGATVLAESQRAALAEVRDHARRCRDAARRRIERVLERCGVACDVDGLVRAAAGGGGLAINFHPDRIAADGRMVAEAMLEDGIYRSQFETMISAGGLTAYPGGDRDRWEERLFGGAYQRAGVRAEDRPKYGGLNLMGHGDGPCPRFGSCHLVVRPAVAGRATYCFGDSHLEPPDRGTIDAFEPIVAALLERAEATGEVLGRRPMAVPELVQRMSASPRRGPEQGRALDDYIEAQIHGSLTLADDADELVADPSFRATPVGQLLADIAERHALHLTWHRGFELDAADVPTEFRGPAIPLLARRIATELELDIGEGSRPLDAELIGGVARSVVTEPDRWTDWAAPAETLQHIKQLWHVLVRYGRPRGGSDPARDEFRIDGTTGR